MDVIAKERYSRHMLLSEIGEEGQQLLLKTKVLVVGAGGLGCPVLQYLAAAGIGTLGIIDDDTVAISNLQRQVLFGSASLGENKAIAARERLHDLNPGIDIKAYPEKLTVRNAWQLCTAYDIIVDGTDNFSARYMINDACVLSGKPLVYGAIYKFQGQVTVFNYRKGPTYRCLFPDPPKPGAVPSCNDIGVLGVLPGITGIMQANEVLKISLNLGAVLSGKLLIYDLLSLKFNTVTFYKNQKEIARVPTKDVFKTTNYDLLCGLNTPAYEIDAEEALRINVVQFIDIREIHELPKVEEICPLYVSRTQMHAETPPLDTTKHTVIFCQSGIRSRKTVRFLKARGFENVYSLKGGAIALKKAVTLLKSFKTHEREE